MYDLPLEYKKEQNILNITGGVGMPLQIDTLTISLYHCLYARVLVDVDFTQPLTEKILAKMTDVESNLGSAFS